MLTKELKRIVMHIDSSDDLDVFHLFIGHILHTEMPVSPTTDTEKRMFLKNLGSNARMVLPLAGNTIKSFNGVLEINLIEPHACRLFRVKIIDK